MGSGTEGGAFFQGDLGQILMGLSFPNQDLTSRDKLKVTFISLTTSPRPALPPLRGGLGWGDEFTKGELLKQETKNHFRAYKAS
jgi:hypothetical protein